MQSAAVGGQFCRSCSGFSWEQVPMEGILPNVFLWSALRGMWEAPDVFIRPSQTKVCFARIESWSSASEIGISSKSKTTRKYNDFRGGEEGGRGRVDWGQLGPSWSSNSSGDENCLWCEDMDWRCAIFSEVGSKNEFWESCQSINLNWRTEKKDIRKQFEWKFLRSKKVGRKATEVFQEEFCEFRAVVATDVFSVIHKNLLGFTLDSRTNFCDADAGGYLGQEATEVGLFKGVTYTARFKMGVISFE